MARERPGQRHALGLSTGERRRLAVPFSRQAYASQPAARFRQGGRVRHSPRSQAKGHVLRDRQVRKQQVILEDHADRSPLGRHPDAGRRLFQHVTVQRDPPAGERQKPGQRSHQRGFARAIGAQDGDDIPRRDTQLDIQVEGTHRRLDLGVECHGVPSQRSRSAIRTARETESSSRLSTMAA